MQEPYGSQGAEYAINPLTLEVVPLELPFTERHVPITIMNNLVMCKRWLASTKYDFCVRYNTETCCLECYYKGTVYQFFTSVFDFDVYMLGVMGEDLYAIMEDGVEKIDSGSVFLSKKCTGNKPDESELMYIRPSYFNNSIPFDFNDIKIIDDKVFIDGQEYSYAHPAIQLGVSVKKPVIRGIEVSAEHLLTIREDCFSSELLIIADTNNAEQQVDINWLRDGSRITGFIFEYKGNNYVVDLHVLTRNIVYPNPVIVSVVKYSNCNEDTYFRICLGADTYKDIGIDGVTTVSSGGTLKEICIKTDLTTKQIRRCLLLGGIEKLYEK